ncbi:TIGR04282 family arsenosugar biosynthesis glycosyltransferase [Hymenobacter guriensis]|uniref:TIGR04282 family arsenosugar biosynthesis glycosyltransferase n=1 Tax=Hymenobacter guriensis TaxID=2793065 RepID=A0ABS0L2U6_9BACT|nr:TIGR04282 family arsenosugar biosynthesis glycosyltransferase [Hymenobacter guriensis]MBG8553697.1 TIGR04282 family arsenosugar biosynthesis glycosyltransferase [Hymenobacter guriensis]
MSSAPGHLLVFARYPELGKVKTRLAADIGPAAALAVYQELLIHTQAVAAPLPVAKTVWLVAPGPTADLSESWTDYELQLQPPGDLGARMHAAFAHAFAQGAGRVLIIGTDCPGLTTAHLQTALEALRTHDVVLGPAADGGYYLLGLTRLYPELFADKPWSTATVRAETLRDAAGLGLRVHLLPELHDVDTAADLARWRNPSA